MKRLIFYPGFEAQNEKWLKFAVLYFGELSPILPFRARPKLSDLYRRLDNETDLLNLQDPRYMAVHDATMLAIDKVKQLEADPHAYEHLFLRSNSIRDWEDPRNHNYELWQEKFADRWMSFCMDRGYGTQADVGVKLPADLAKLFLTVLANRIADEDGISPITDEPMLHRLTYFLGKSTPVVRNESVNAMAVVNLALPRRLESIHWDDIIRLRKSKDFKKAQTAFHSTLSDFLGGYEYGDHSADFYKQYEDSKFALTEQLLSLSTDLSTVGLNTFLLLNAQAPQLSDAEKLIVSGLGVAIKQGYSFTKAWKSSANDRNCRRYLTRIRALG